MREFLQIRWLFVFTCLALLAGCPGEGGDDDDSADAGPVEIDLSTYPDSGEPVPSGTVLSDQWAGIGVLFDAAPDDVDPVMDDFGGGTPHLFFAPDVADAVAIISFVEPGTTTPVEVSAFALYPWFNPGESAELVGLDASGAEVVTDTVTSDDIGDDSLTLEMRVEGAFTDVEWRTHGNPGIAASGLVFEP